MENKMFTLRPPTIEIVGFHHNVKKSDGTLLLFKDKKSAQEWVEREEKLFDKN